MAACEFIPEGSVTSSQGFKAGAVYCGLKTPSEGTLDLGILACDVPCPAAGVFTLNRFRAAPVLLSEAKLRRGQAQAVVVNSGCANAATGDKGLKDAAIMGQLAAARLNIEPPEVLVASTGVIGRRLDMDKIKKGTFALKLSKDGGHALARAIMTTDTRPKEAAVKTGSGYVVGGVAKGAGMIHPNMGTMLCFLTTDAKIETGFLAEALKKAADISFNMVSVDGDTSPNDTVIILASGLACSETIKDGAAADEFQEVLNTVCIHLAKTIAADGEGATRLIEVKVTGAATEAGARLAARTITTSPLVKTSVHGCDPNWGRIMAAASRSGVAMEAERVDLSIEGIDVVKSGRALIFDEAKASRAMRQDEVSIKLNLNLGQAEATAWGCDLTAKYVSINSDYTT